MYAVLRHAINFAFLSDIRDKLTPETGLQEVKKTTERMFDEMQGYAEAASFDELSRLTAKDALENFLHGAEAFERPGGGPSGGTPGCAHGGQTREVYEDVDSLEQRRSDAQVECHGGSQRHVVASGHVVAEALGCFAPDPPASVSRAQPLRDTKPTNGATGG